MKKSLIFIMFMLATVASAQCPIKFKGIDITGNLLSFEKLLHKKGFTNLTVADAYRGMEGKFGGEDVILWVYATPKSETIRCVSVVYGFDKFNNFPIKERYEMMKNRLINKYGTPTELDVSDEVSNYCTRWIYDCGGITVKAHYIDDLGTAIVITYWSREGEMLNEEEHSEDL